VRSWCGICLEQGADLHMAQLMPSPLTVSCFSKIQIGFSFLVLAHPGSPGQRAIKRVCVKYITTSPRELMCKIWLESIRPLRICACVKNTLLCGFFINISRVCAVAQYAVLEVNAEVNRRGPFSPPPLRNLLTNFDVMSIYYYVLPWS